MRRHSDEFTRDLAELRTIARRLRASEEAEELRVLRLVDCLDVIAEGLEADAPEPLDPERPAEPVDEPLPVFGTDDDYPF